MQNFFEKIEKNQSPYIIAEIGSNHNGDMQFAEDLILSAKKCGADCVKFQSFNKTSINSKEDFLNNKVFTDSPKKHFGSLEEMVEKYYLRKEQHYLLRDIAIKKGVDFSSTPFSEEEVDLLVELNVPFLKIASMDINNYQLLRYCASTGKPIILSTGMADLSEIEIALNIIESTGNKQIILLHCISIYPPKFEDINLNNIPMLKKTFGYPVGFSDHSIGIEIPLAAVTLGACIIEKHFTLDKNLPGWDHEISADPKELSEIVKFSNNITMALGNFRRVVSQDEIIKRKKFRRSLVVKSDIKKDDLITENNLTAKRPGTGIPPSEIKYVIGRKTKRDYSADEVLRWEDLE